MLWTLTQKLQAAILALGCLCVLMYSYQAVLHQYSVGFQPSDTSTYSTKPLEVDCNPGVPCEYPEIVDLRIIILTMNRNISLTKLLKSLDKLEMGSDTARMEIWVDRDAHGEVDKDLLQVAQTFNWSKGKVRTHIQKHKVGLYGQWIHTWHPPANGKEIAIILEDDLSVSPLMYRWLKAAHAAYGGRSDVAGYTLTCTGFQFKKPGFPYFHKMIGTYGYSPHPKAWQQFQEWYAIVRQDILFHPYTNHSWTTAWYKGYEKNHYEHSMWSQWFIYFCDKFDFYSLYPDTHNMVDTTKEMGRCLGMHREVRGLHAYGKGRDNDSLLLTVWKDEFIKFPNPPKYFGWNGRLYNPKKV